MTKCFAEGYIYLLFFNDMKDYIITQGLNPSNSGPFWTLRLLLDQKIKISCLSCRILQGVNVDILILHKILTYRDGVRFGSQISAPLLK